MLLGGEPSLRCDVFRIAEKYFLFVNTFVNGQIKIPKEFKNKKKNDLRNFYLVIIYINPRYNSFISY